MVVRWAVAHPGTPRPLPLGLGRLPFNSRAHVANWNAQMPTSPVDAFAKFGAKLESPVHGRSAIAGDGSLVLSCSILCFRRPGPGVLRYEDLLSRDPPDKKNTALLGEHLTLAR